MRLHIFSCFIWLLFARAQSSNNEDNDITVYREKVEKMFYHAYDGYIKYAYPYDELQPITCNGVDTWGSYSLTLIDSLDTLAVMKNYTEFRRVANLLQERLKFNDDINVSVFESNIRVVGGLLTAHLYSKEAGLPLNDEWPCDGPLLRLAEKIAIKLLPAFDTITGMPIGTVNLANGADPNETPITCTAGVGTFIVEFGALSRLTGNNTYEEKALKALHALHRYRSSIGLVSDHINTSNGKWVGSESGIGAGIDSYFEYLFKGAVLLERPELMAMFEEYYDAIAKYMKQGDWYMWVNMHKGSVSIPIQQSLETFWPGVQTLYGDVESAYKTILNYYEVFRKFGALPEFYNIETGKSVNGREGYPLRPELIESTLYLYRATKDPILLDFGKSLVDMIETVTKTKCGYATIKNVNDRSLDNRMESFFLAETLKYLYLLFSPTHQLNLPKSSIHQFPSDGQTCVINNGYIFNTEAHPIDFGSLKCCQKRHNNDNDSGLISHILSNTEPTDDGMWSKMTCPSKPYYLKLLKQGEIYVAN